MTELGHPKHAQEVPGSQSPHPNGHAPSCLAQVREWRRCQDFPAILSQEGRSCDGSVSTLGLDRTCLLSGALAWAQLSSCLPFTQVHRQQAGPGIGGCQPPGHSCGLAGQGVDSG